jgi:inner membrane transporter RhtA
LLVILWYMEQRVAARSPAVRSGRAGMGVPPHLYFVVSAIFHYLGPSFAVLLFARVEVLGVAWLRIASAALIFCLWRRPWRAFAALDRDVRRLLLGWGGVLAVMNSCFYVAISRLPLGTVAAIEFLPVIALAALGARSPRNVLALCMAVPGAYLLTDVRLAGAAVGFAFAFANAALFALYIVLADRVAKRPQLSGIDGLAAAMLIAAVAITPIGGWQAAHAFTDPIALFAGIGVGVSSSVIPYVTDQLAMVRLPRASYATMVALLPAFATIIGIIVLTQIPTWTEATGILLVIGGVAVHRPRDAARDKQRAQATVSIVSTDGLTSAWHGGSEATSRSAGGRPPARASDSAAYRRFSSLPPLGVGAALVLGRLADEHVRDLRDKAARTYSRS